MQPFNIPLALPAIHVSPIDAAWSFYHDNVGREIPFVTGDPEVEIEDGELLIDYRSPDRSEDDYTAYHKLTLEKQQSSQLGIPHPLAVSWTRLMSKEIPPKPVFVELDGQPMITGSSLTEVFAGRGIGKSAFIASLIGLMVDGGRLGLTKITSPGDLKVLLVDGELPESDIKDRLIEFAQIEKNTHLLNVRHNGMYNDATFAPKLNTPGKREAFIDTILAQLKPDVVVFDTRTALFAYDTNDTKETQAINDFLVTLRALGYAVIVVHHAGKNGTQRGRSDNDDQLDLVIKLSARDGWQPGEGLQFALSFEKVRHKSRLQGFEAVYVDSQYRDGVLTQNGMWQTVANELYAEIVSLSQQGLSSKEIATKLGISASKVQRHQRLARKNGVALPEVKAGKKSKK